MYLSNTRLRPLRHVGYFDSTEMDKIKRCIMFTWVSYFSYFISEHIDILTGRYIVPLPYIILHFIPLSLKVLLSMSPLIGFIHCGKSSPWGVVVGSLFLTHLLKLKVIFNSPK